MERDVIRIRGARQHNLKNLDVDLPRNQLVVITGPSGSGKSSLAFDTLYAEGQRRYVESLSTYARQFIDQMDKPEVDAIEGLSPAIAIEQRTSSPNPRSTVATMTEIYDYLRVLYAATGRPHDPVTGDPLSRTTIQEMVDFVLAQPEKTRVQVLAPGVGGEGNRLGEIFERLGREGFVRARVDGDIIDLQEIPPKLAKRKASSAAVDIVVDRLAVRTDIRSRLYDSLETALRWSAPRVLLLLQAAGAETWEETAFTTTFSNPATGFTMPELTPGHFSFNARAGACPACHGIGARMRCDPGLIVPDPGRSIRDGAVKTWWAKNKKLRAGHDRRMAALAAHFEVDETAPFEGLPEEFREAVLHGTGDTAIRTGWKTGANTRSLSKPFEGLVNEAERLYETSKSVFTKRNVARFMNPTPCPSCHGRRLRPEILAVTLEFGGDRSASIDELTALSIDECGELLPDIAIADRMKGALEPVLAELEKRLAFLRKVGVGYLNLDRRADTLSGGEFQRIRLATQIGSALSGVLYVLDEPSIGLHQSDNDRLLETLAELKALGNTVIVVEHDADTMRAADHLVDLGPGAGPHGGEIIAQGDTMTVQNTPGSVTGAFLSGARTIERPPGSPAREGELFDGFELKISGAREHNLKDIDVSIPLGQFVCVTGVSGSGKSTLIDDVLRREVFRRLYGAKDAPGAHGGIDGLEHLDKAIVIDQSPIGRSPRSNPVTYAGAFSPIRDLLSQTQLARQRGYGPGRFSFNVSGGRCEACQGAGSVEIDMHFLEDAYVTCEACGGTRFQRETLDVTYRGRNVAEILDLTISEAAEFFQLIPKIHSKLGPLEDVGLGYLKLGQPATTLSGGEAQRVKLAAELGKRATGKTLFLLDEPTTGLHFTDIETLLGVLFRLRDAGNSILVIEHNLDVIKCADWIIDLGPGGGPHGGKVVATGPPAAVARHPESLTGRYLAKVL